MKTEINIDQICSIKTNIESEYPNYYYAYLPEIRIFGILNRKEGLYERESFFSSWFLIDEEKLKKVNLISKDKKIFYRNHIKIRMSNDKLITKYFETVDELNKYILEIKKVNNNWIEL